MLFERARHASLDAPAWKETAARSAIAHIAEDAGDRFDPETFWPAHPADDFVEGGATQLYFGAAGNIWALEHLRREGAADVPVKFDAVLPRLLACNRAEMAMMAPRAGFDSRQASFLMGDIPILLLQMKTAQGPDAADDLHARISANLSLPVLELMWGIPGTMFACVFAHRITSEDRWPTLFRAQAEKLLTDLVETEQGALWIQHLYGQLSRYLGLVHGFAGNAAALIAGWSWLTEEERARLRDVIARMLVIHAQCSHEGANWPATADRGSPAMLVQVCHGAPGMVVAFANSHLATPELIGLLQQAGELTWSAGPLAKGSNLCHGTGGNGYAFLKLYALTGEKIWLERARAFAMHAIRQWREAFARYGRGRYSLWTGDPGLAVYLWDCVRGTALFPTLDVF